MSVFVHKDFQEQLTILENRNMKINNREKSIRTLQVVSYYKIKEFAHPFVDKSKEDIDYNGISFELIISRYYQDKNLRISLLHAIEDIEVALQTQISYVLGKDNYGPYGYLNFYTWCNRDEYCGHFLSLKEKEFKKQLKTALYKNKSPEIKEKMRVDNQKYPPIWLGINLLTFGQLLEMLDLMSNRNLSIISQEYGCTNLELISWLRCLN
ncbi:Abi family protein, partial [Aerococcaceae bacterium NML210727]|nr:Abi family protein [Aerococcaceae bacterium NML210727]